MTGLYDSRNEESLYLRYDIDQSYQIASHKEESLYHVLIVIGL